MPDASTPLPATLAECDRRLLEMAAAHARQQATINEQQATIAAYSRLRISSPAAR